MTSPKVLDNRSDRIATLILPYLGVDDEWNNRIRSILSWGTAHKSSKMSELFIRLLQSGAYDEIQATNQSYNGFWNQLREAEKENPKFVIDVVKIWLARAVEKYDDGESLNYLNDFPQNRSHNGALLVSVSAAKEPRYFVDKLLPQFVEIAVNTQMPDELIARNRTWPFISNHGDPFNVDDGILLSMRKSLQWLAVNDADHFKVCTAEMKETSLEIFSYLLLRAWTDNPEQFADECAEYLAADINHMHIGYGSWSGSDEGTGSCAISRQALIAITPHCSSEVLNDLEETVIDHVNEYEKSFPRWRGQTELLLLRSFEHSRISQKAKLRIEELERKFPDFNDAIVKEDNTDGARFVAPPIEENILEIMTDAQWLSAMRKYHSESVRFNGGPVELSRSLANFANQERERFAALIDQMDDEINPLYFSAILEGLCGRHRSLGQDDKTKDKEEMAALPTHKFVDVIKRLHFLPDRPCGKSLVDAVQILAERDDLPDEVLGIVSFYAISDPDPEADIWKKDVSGKPLYGGDPHHHGINCVRGRAAEAISEILFKDESRYEILKPALVHLVNDNVISVRTCAIDAICPLLNFEREQAVRFFLQACNGNQDICGTRPFANFVQYACHTHYDELRSLLQFALSSKNEDAVDIAAKQIVLTELNGLEVGEDAEKVRTGNEQMRKAAAKVYARNIAEEEVGDQCASMIEQYFNDESEKVRQDASNAFFHLEGERLFQLESLINIFIESKSFERNADDLLMVLDRSNAELPAVIFHAAQRIFDLIGVEGADITKEASMTSYRLSELIVRQYEQSTDESLKSQCLDVIDEMERLGYHGISGQLNKLDRETGI